MKWLSCRIAPLGLAVALGASFGPCRAQDQSPLYLMFPYDYLSLGESERRHYVLGVVDSLLTQALGSEAHRKMADCLAANGMGALIQLIENELIPRPNFGGVPMTVLVKHGVANLCDG